MSGDATVDTCDAGWHPMPGLATYPLVLGVSCMNGECVARICQECGRTFHVAQRTLDLWFSENLERIGDVSRP